MAPSQLTVSPVDGSIYVERPYATPAQVAETLQRATDAQRRWQQSTLAERSAICRRAVDLFVERTTDIAQELTWQMGRPIAASPGEVRGFAERARFMIDAAESALADVVLEPKAGFQRFIQRHPLGVVLVIAAWNYPYLIAVNSVIPAIMAGNAVILKHSSQTPLCAERIATVLQEAGLPPGVFQYLHLDHAATEKLVAEPQIDFVAFTGSVRGGHVIQQAASARFIGTGLELGGKDPAYVRPDANFNHAVENLVDGSFFNSGQSCCAVERIYVHRDIYDRFVEAFVALTREYRLGNPTDPNTNLGPLVRTSAALGVQRQIDEAVAQGATPLIDPAHFPAHQPGTPYLAPQVLINVNHSMSLMTEETFGPAIGIMPVASDEEAVHWMNDSQYGLTAAVWTADPEAALRLGRLVNTGTWFMNRCDYLDPGLAWVGIKDSGRGCTLSRIGYEYLTRPKSFHLRVET